MIAISVSVAQTARNRVVMIVIIEFYDWCNSRGGEHCHA